MSQHAEKNHDEWCPANGCRCGLCPCAQMPECDGETHPLWLNPSNTPATPDQP